MGWSTAPTSRFSTTRRWTSRRAAAQRACLVICSLAPSELELLAEAAMRVYVLAEAGNGAREFAAKAAAVPRIGRVWHQGRGRLPEMDLHRQWMEEAFLARTAEAERRAIPEHDRRARLAQLRRYRSTIRNAGGGRSRFVKRRRSTTAGSPRDRQRVVAALRRGLSCCRGRRGRGR